MNLSHFKKHSEDENSATLIHPDGHQIKIAKKALNHTMKAQLNKLPMYSKGSVDVEPSDSESVPINLNTPTPIPESLANSPSDVPQPTPVSPDAPYLSGPDQETAMNLTRQSPVSDMTLPQSAPTHSAASASPSLGMPSGLMQRGLNNQLAGIQGQAKAEGDLGKQNADIEKQSQVDEKKHYAAFRQHYDDLDQHRQNLESDIASGHVDPNRLWNNASTAGKVSTAVGLILGGIGGGLTHQENPAMKFLNEAINRDVESQKAELGKNENLLSANYRQFGNLQDAEKMTRINQTDLVASQLRQAAATATDPIVKARALQMEGQLKMSVAPQQQALAISQMAASGKLPAKYQEFLHQDVRSRAVSLPNGMLGMAPTAADAEGVRKSMSSLQNISQQLDNMTKDMNQNGRTILPYGERAATADGMKDNIVLEMNSLHGINRLNDNEFNTYKNQIPTSGDWNEGRAQAKISVLKNLVNNKIQDEFRNHLEGYNPNQIQQGKPVLSGR